jgi:2-oxoglutarate/2-oxoacid ferredoxin oxidoreductase subunit beta
MSSVKMNGELNIPRLDDDFTPLTGKFLREERLPHIWCSTCGIGVVITAFISGLQKSELNPEKVCVVSGIGCSGRAAGYLRLDSFHTTHGRAIPFATGLALGNPELKVVVISGDGDIAAIGGNHLIHSARRNMNLTVICINNFTYAMTGGQAGPTTPIEANASTTLYGCFEAPFNLPFLADSSGAVYVARWTTMHVRRLADSITEALCKSGFSFIEVISPCPTSYARRNKLGTGLDLMKFYRENSTIQNGADTRKVDISFGSKITVGKFVDIEKPSFIENRNHLLEQRLGDRYIPYGGPNGH